MGKVLWVALLGLWLATFSWMHDIEGRQRRGELMDRAIFQAQQEAFSLHAKSINQTMDLVVRMAKEGQHEPTIR